MLKVEVFVWPELGTCCEMRPGRFACVGYFPAKTSFRSRTWPQLFCIGFLMGL